MRRILGSFWFHSPLMPQWMGGKVSASHCSSFSFLVGGGCDSHIFCLLKKFLSGACINGGSCLINYLSDICSAAL